MTERLHPLRIPAIARIVTGLVVGAATVLVLPGVEPWIARLLTGWVAFTIVITALLIPLMRCDGERTARIATREDDTRGLARTLSLLAATVSLAGSGIVLHEANTRDGGGATALVILGLATVFVSWLVLHLEYTLHYAHRYYADGGGVTFPAESGEEPSPPDFRDFAYLSFTLGMTFQVSDNNVTTRRMRRLVLGHCLLSYLFSAVIIAVTINAVASFVR